MTKNRLSKLFKKKIIILTSVFLALIAGLSTSALWLNSRHEQKVLSAAKQTYTGHEIIQADSEITSDDIGTDNIVLTSIASAQTNDESNNSAVTKHIYLADISKANDKEKIKFNEYISNKKIVANDEIVFNVASPDDNHPTNQSVNQINLQGKTLRQYADEQGKKLVAVIDTGISSDYSSFQKNFTDEADADENGHGTAVAKTILANANDKAIVLSLKAMGKDGTGYMSDVMAAVQYARKQHVDIINMSISAPDNGSSSIFKQQITDTIAEGIRVVAAAGNYNSSAMTYIPANIEGVISVGAMDANNKKIESSNYAATYYEKADSTSQAAAILTGKLVNNTDLSDEVNDSTIKTEKNDINPNMFYNAGKTIETMSDGSTEMRSYIGINVNGETYSKAIEKGNKVILTTFDDITGVLDHSETLYDKTYGIYHTLVENDNIDYSLLRDKKIDFFTSDVPKEFSVQGSITASGRPSNWHNASSSLWITVNWSDNGSGTLSGTITVGCSNNNISYNGAKWSVFGAFNKSGTVNMHWTGGGSTQVGTVSTYQPGATVTVGCSLTLNGIRWNGKTVNFSCSNTSQSFKISDDKVTYTVSFNSNGGSNQPTAISKTVAPGANYTIGLPSPGSKTGYSFAGWYDGGTNVGSGQWTTTGNHTLTASWTAIKYTISFNKGTIDKYYDTNWYYGPIPGTWYYNDVQTMPGSRTATYQQTFWLPSSSEATAKGYTLRGWKLDGTSTIYSPGQAVTAQPNNMSFTAVWYQKDDHTMKITTNVNDKESADLTNPVNGEQIYSVTATTQRINRENVGSESWTRDSNNKKRGSDNLITFNRSTLRQGYTNQDDKTYDFYEGGRWNNTKGTDATSGNKTADFGKDGQPTITARVSHEANSSQELVMYVRGNTYNVIFDPNDMTGAAKDGFVTPDDAQFVRHNGPATVTRSFTYGKNETIPDNLGISWSGHKLVGWSTSPNPYKDSNAITYLVNTNNNDRTSWYFGYIGGYRNNGTTKNTTSGIDASFAPSSDGVVPDNPSQIVTKDHAIVLYAVWERNNVSITIDPNNGTWDGNGRKTSRTVKWGDNMLLGSQQNNMVTPPDNAVSVIYNPEKGTIDRTSDTSNYEFDHWLILDTASQKEAKDLDHGFIRTKTESKSGDGTNQYFAGAQATTLQAKYYYTIITLPLPVREGYTFLGWYYDDAYMEAAGKAGDEYRIPARKAREYNNHVTLYARWVKNDYQYGDTIDSRMENLNSPDHQPETYKFAIGKTNRNGKPLDGAVIEISQAKYVNDQPSFDPDNVVLTMDESKGGLIDRSGKVLVSTKNAGMYTYETKNKNDIPLTENTIYVARETKAPQGYFTADDYVFTYTGYDTINIRDDKISTNLSLIKNSIYPDQTIENAKFELYDLTTDPNKQHVLAIAVSDRYGKIQLSPNYKTPDKQYLTDYITAGDQMLLHEFNAPVNFQVQDFKFTIPKQKRKIDNIPFEYTPDTKTAILTDSPAYINLKITKLDGQDKTKKLPNVTFQLFVMKDGALYPAVRNRRNNQLLDPYKNAEEYQKNKDNIITATTGSIPGTNDYGVATFTNLSPKALATGSADTERDQYIAEIDDNGKESDWYLKEIKNPNEGYNLLSKPMILRISENEVRERRESGEITPTFYFNVYNGKVIETLNAGGNGTLSYILIGTVLIIVGAVYLRKKKKLPA